MFIFAGILLVLALILLLIPSGWTKQLDIPSFVPKAGGLAVGGLGTLLALWACSVSVPAGHVYVPTLFGQPTGSYYESGLHIVNPLYSMQSYDCRYWSIKETVSIPTQDKLSTEFDVNIQWRIVEKATPNILAKVGKSNDVKDTLLIPKFRSVLREQGKSVKQADEFFNDHVHTQMQTTVLTEMKAYMAPLGVEVTDVLIREIRLPHVLVDAVAAMKQREIEVLRQKAELDRFRIEQQQKVEAAMAELEAAKRDADKKRALADATAYEIKALNDAMASNPNYIQLQSLEALKHMAKDPSAKFYFIDGNSPRPLPLMHLGAIPLPAPK